MDLLEREALLATLAQTLTQASAGAGHTILVTGEAGIGKTSLVEQFVAQHAATVRTLWGTCETLFTPRPLGPLYDITPQMDRAFRQTLAMGETGRSALFAALLHDLQAHAQPTLFVIEDIHWADEGTLDLVKFLGRRLHRLKLLLLLTYRDDEIGPDHPLRLVLGDLPSQATLRLKIPPLSEAAVARMAASTHHPTHAVYRATGGNPFFVTELLATATLDVPATVSDAVLARVARLSPQARSLLDLASVIPNRIEPWLLPAIFPPASEPLNECFTSGMFQADKDFVSFRHELARQAIESALTPPQRQAAHMQVLQAWLAHGVAPDHYARVLHHAVQAQERDLIVRFAPLAAQYAADHCAHQEPAAHYATLLKYAQDLAPTERATWLEAHAYECYLTGQISAAEQSRREALALWAQARRPDKEGPNLRWLSRLNWYLGRSAEAEAYATQAVGVLETLPPGTELAMAYSNMAQLRMLAEDAPEALRWGRRAIAMAEAFADPLTLAHALNNVGTAELHAGDEGGRPKLERSLALALEHGLEEHAARAYVNLATTAVVWRNYPLALHYLAEGIAYTTENDLDSWRDYLASWRVRALLETGQWDAAAHEALTLLGHPRITPVSKITALVALATIRLRRDDPGGLPLLDEAYALAERAGELQRIVPVAVACAEVAWLKQQPEQARQAVLPAFALARTRGNPWGRGELAYWLWRADGLSEDPGEIAEPYAQHIAGDWHAAALTWQRLGCPYEQAMALMDGDEAAQRQALGIFEHLLARPATEMVRRRLREQGIRQIPRGPRATTQKNPLGLTNRQLEVLVFLVAGQQNATIAQHLFTSTKTIDHHVSAILLKFGAQTRAEAITKAYQLGIIAPTADNIGK
ncbi:MAG: AAA family ATPase [Ktedonobacterales bacterium]|nr:AAA family ATPase [Ktedonobacterales bacterium]